MNSVKQAFTIVELLIVVVVIAILAAITIVSYNGITTQAKEATLRSNLSTIAKKVEMIKTHEGAYPESLPDGLSSPYYWSQGDAFCATAADGDVYLHITQEGVVRPGACMNPVEPE